MGALVWLLIPLAAAVLAAIWGHWAARRRVTGDGDSLAGYERFRAAMEPPAAGGGPAAERIEQVEQIAGPAAGRQPDREAEQRPERPARRRDDEESPRGPVAGPVP
ncbi:hypothetical protein OG552_24155 [Streptomyces sp. NBC_01476]|uniref:hypothetical protein n=1 Tax=Streptomyces sp. NBC_01476 TaxID=2903881 RepID=UPI002E2F2948|nr:hypothetical protein [Streptomyces sp. NBC_01476]